MSESEEQQKFQLDLQQMNAGSTKNIKTKQLKLNNWVIYCKPRGKKSGNEDYQKDMEKVGQFDTISGFFRLYTAIKEPSQLDVDVKLMYFLKGCDPLWEKWLNSGCLLFYVRFKDENKDKFGSAVLNKIWEYLLLSSIGNSLPSQRITNQGRVKEEKGKENIVGIILGRREKLNIIQVWFRSDRNALHASRLIEADVIKQLTSIKDYEKSLVQVRYKLHKDSLSSQSTIKGSHVLKGLNSSF